MTWIKRMPLARLLPANTPRAHSILVSRLSSLVSRLSPLLARTAELARQRIAAEAQLLCGAAAMIVVFRERGGEHDMVETLAAARVHVMLAATQAFAHFARQRVAPIVA